MRVFVIDGEPEEIFEYFRGHPIGETLEDDKDRMDMWREHASYFKDATLLQAMDSKPASISLCQWYGLLEEKGCESVVNFNRALHRVSRQIRVDNVDAKHYLGWPKGRDGLPLEAVLDTYKRLGHDKTIKVASNAPKTSSAKFWRSVEEELFGS